MTTTLSTYDRFSWHRVGAVAGYYAPALRTQIIVYPLVSLAIGAVTYILNCLPGGIAMLGSMLSIILSFMCYFGPIVFARRSNKAIETLLPATSAEKSTFIVTYCMVSIPLLTYLPFYLCTYILEFLFGASDNEIIQLASQLEVPKLTKLSGMIQTLVPLATCMFVVMMRDTNRSLMGMVWAVVSLIVASMIAGIYGAVIAFRMGFADEQANAGADPEEISEQIAQHIATDLTATLQPFIIILGAICLLYVILMIVLTCRTIKNQQI